MKMTKEFLGRQKYNAKYLLATGSLGIAAATPVVTFAAEDVTAAKIVGRMIYYIGTIFRFIGILLLAWGVGQLVLAFKNEDADSKSRAMMLIVVSIILITIESIIKAILEATGSSVKDYITAGTTTTTSQS